MNTDVDIVDFLNVIEMYEYEVVHLYVEHTMDHAVMINETLLLEYSQTQVGEGGGGVDEVHTAIHEHGDGGVDKVQMADREDADGVNTNEQIKDYQATPS